MNSEFSWLSAHWFGWPTLREFVWLNPMYLYLIGLVPVLFGMRWLLHIRSRQKLPFALPARNLRFSLAGWLRFLPDVLLGFSMVLILMALARPQRIDEKTEYFSEGIDIMLLLDISESMLIRDLKPNRLEAAKRVARNFIAGRFQDRIGIVVFAGEAYSLVPLTTDYYLLYQFLTQVKSNLISSEGTAIGSALAVATNRMRDSDSKTKVAVLVSDGDNTAGNIDPITAAELAYMHHIKLYTIAVGTGEQTVINTAMQDSTGMPPASATTDENTLRQIAAIGEGQFFRATDENTLAGIFARIDTYEKAEIKETRYQDTQDFYRVYLNWAIVFLLLWLLSRSTFVSNVLED